MYQVETYARIRRAVVVEGLSIREAARRFGIHRKTIRKMLAFPEPPGYRRSGARSKPKLGPFVGVIEEILREDVGRPPKQRHTAKRIFERLRAEHGYGGGYTAVKDHVRWVRESHKEVFVPLAHPPGGCQADFGEALAIIAGVLRKIHYLVFILPFSDAIFVKAYPAETTEAFCDGHNAAFWFFGGVPLTMLYDNTKLAVARIGPGKLRIKTRTFASLESHFLFASKFGRVARGNDKGHAEGLVGFARRNFLVPVPRANSFDELNEKLEADCRARMSARLRGEKATIGQRFAEEQRSLLPLPAVVFDACDRWATRVSSLSLVRYRRNDYSVPTRFGHREVLVRGYVFEVVISCAAEVIARHERSYESEDLIFDPLHYLALLEQKTGALDQAAPLANWDLPREFAELRRQLEARLGNPGKREYIQVLRLLETFSLAEVAGAVRDALQLGAIGFDAVKHLVLCAIDRRPPRLNLALYPYLPSARVAKTSASSYLELLERRTA